MDARPRPCLLVDWGGTVMEDLPGCTGPMADWPRVVAVPGAAAALAGLRSRARLALATGAADSDEEAVRRALRRAGLEALFDAVLCSRDLGARKPDPGFFAAALRRLGIDAAEAVMVGDEYERDASASLAAGLRAVWLNRRGAERPGGPRLVTVGAWEEVGDALDRLGFPAAPPP